MRVEHSGKRWERKGMYMGIKEATHAHAATCTSHTHHFLQDFQRTSKSENVVHRKKRQKEAHFILPRHSVIYVYKISLKVL